MHCLDEIGDLEDYERNGILRYLLDLKAQERDYSVIATLTPKDTKGTCVYCKHCHPCPAGLDIGLINKYYDLSRLGDVLAKERYGCGSAACRYTLPRQDAPFFTERFGEFAASQRAGRAAGPCRTPANPYCPANFDCKAGLPQQFKRNYLQIRCTVTGGAYHSGGRRRLVENGLDGTSLRCSRSLLSCLGCI